MVQFLPATGFGAKFAEAFPEAFRRGFKEHGESEKQSKLLSQKHSNQLKLEEEKIRLKEESKNRESDYLAKLLGVGSPSQTNESAEENDMAQVWENLDPINKALIAQRNPQFASQLQKDVELRSKKSQDEVKEANRKFESDRKFETKRADPIIKRADELRLTLPNKEIALEGLEDAIKTGNNSFFSLNNLADKTGIEAFRDPAGAQFKSSVKEYFLGDLARVGARPNQWIEQQLADALPKMGRDANSNLIVTSGFRAKLDIEKKWLDEMDRTEEHYEKTLGYVPGKIGKEVNKIIAPYAEARQKQLKEEIETIKKRAKPSSGIPKPSQVPEGYVYMINPDTNEQLYIQQGDVEEARKEGFKLKK